MKSTFFDKTNNMTVLSNSSCLATEINVGIYTVSSSVTSIQFTKMIDHSGYNDFSSNSSTFTIDDDENAESSLFSGRLLFIKK